MGYYFLVTNGPLWQPVIWGVAFFIINAVQLYLLFKSRKPVRLSPQEYETLQRIDPALDHKLYRMWMEIANISKGTASENIHKDSVAVHIQENGVNLVNAAGFVDANKREPKSVQLSQNDELLSWNIDELKTRLNELPELRTFWQKLITEQLFK